MTHRYLGTVDGNDMFGFIDGYVPQDVGATTQKQLREFMGIVRVLHDISSDFLGDSDKVICHNDLSPCNTVFRDGIPVAVIDWDGASIGGDAGQEASPEAQVVEGTPRRTGRAVRAVALSVAVILILVLLYMVLGRLCPGLFDSMLYDKEQLRVLEYLAE